MAKLKFLGRVYAVEGYDTVMSTLQKNGHEIPNGCGGGHCEACLMQATAGQPMPFSQMDLDQALVDEGYFLACRCMIYDDMDVRLPDDEELSRLMDR